MSSSNTNRPSDMLPEHLHGYIELKTLQDIHYYLSESQSQDEKNDADWIGTNYLYEPISETGRIINTTNNYARLFKAYADVKKLTGKAQDKWPFFNQIWKEIPLATVRKLAKGDPVTNINPRGIGLKAQKLASTNEQKDPDTNTETAPKEMQKDNGLPTNGYSRNSAIAGASTSKSATDRSVPEDAPAANASSTSKNTTEPPVPTNERVATDASASNNITEPSVPTNKPAATDLNTSKNNAELPMPTNAPAASVASISERITRQSGPPNASAVSVARKSKKTMKQSGPKDTTVVNAADTFPFPRLGLAVESEPAKSNLDKLPPAKMMRDYYERKLDIDAEREERRARIEEEKERKERKRPHTNDESQAQEQRKRARLDEEQPSESHEDNQVNGLQLPKKKKHQKRARFDNAPPQYFSEHSRPAEQAPTSFERTVLPDDFPPMPYDPLREERPLWAYDRSIPREEKSPSTTEVSQKKEQKRSRQNDDEDEREQNRARTSKRTKRKASARNGTAEDKVGAKKIAGKAPSAPKTATIEYFARIRLVEAQIDVPIPTKMVDNDHHDMVMRYTIYKAGNDNALSFEDFQAGVKLGKKP